MDLDEIRKQIKMMLCSEIDRSCITMDMLEKKLERLNLIKEDDDWILRNHILEVFREEFQLLCKIECKYFYSSLQEWFDSTKKNKDLLSSFENSDLERIDPKSPFMLFCLNNIKQEILDSQFNSFSDIILSLQVKWNNLSSNEQSDIRSQWYAYRSLSHPSNDFSEDVCYQEFFSTNMPVYNAAVFLPPSISDQLSELQVMTAANNKELLYNDKLYIFQERNDLPVVLHPLSQIETESLKRVRQIVQSSDHKKSKHRKREKAPAKKKRDPTMYNLFLRQRMKEERFENPSMSFVELSQKLSKEWNSMPEEQKRVYCENFKKQL